MNSTVKAAIPTTMRALFVDEIDGPFVLREIPVPPVGAGQVLVRIAASGVNPLDTKIRAGKGGHACHPFPAVLGMDMAGTVVGIGQDVAGFSVGDDVFGFTGGIAGIQGSLAEYAAVDARLLARKPANLSMREAAALPLIFITAWEGLVDRAGVEADDYVLVHGGVGGVGHVAVQIAQSVGAKTFATVRSGDFEAASAFGAIPIDYARESVEQYVAERTAGEGFDIVFDTVGGEVLDASFRAAKTYRGHVVSALGWGTHALAPLSFRSATYSGVFTLLPLLTGKERAHHGDILRQAARLVDAGKLRVRMDAHRFGLDDVEAAHQLVASGKSEGKVVIDVFGATK